MGVLKKLSKVIPEDDMKLMDGEISEMLKKAETAAKSTCDAKEKELNQA